MRTTLDIDDDVLAAAKELALRQKITAGQAVSNLLRLALTRSSVQAQDNGLLPPSGFRPFPSRGTVVSNVLIDQLRDTEGV